MSFDLLDAVLPPEGRYCIIGIGRYPDQRFAETKEEADKLIKEFVDKEDRSLSDCFFGKPIILSSYRENQQGILGA